MQKNTKNRAQDCIFKCEQCEKYFFHKVHLSLHERGHLNQLSNGANSNSVKSLRTQKKSTSTTEKHDNETTNEAKQKIEKIKPRKKEMTIYASKPRTEFVPKLDGNLTSFDRTNVSIEKYKVDIKMNVKDKDKINKCISVKKRTKADESNEKIFLCNICGLTFNQIVVFKEHESKHELTNKKKVISSEIKSIKFMKRNAYNKTRSKRKFCKILSDRNFKILNLKNNLALKKNLRKINLMKKQLKHKKTQNKNNELKTSIDSSQNQNLKNNHSCSQCKKNFFHLQHLRLHEKNHMNINLKTMEEDEEKDMNQFEFNLLKSDNNKLFECIKCNKSFFHLNHLRIHERIHKMEKPNIVYSQEGEIHFNIIEKESCRNELSLSISISPSVNMESTANTTDENSLEKIKDELSCNEKYLDKSYQCKRCNKTFFHELHLKMHQRSHTKIQPHEILKPHKCTMCVASFLELTNLEKHILQMHEKKSYVFSESLINRFKLLYKCDECEKEFKAKSHLASHKRAHFKDSSKELNNIENETESVNNIYIVEEIYGNYNFNSEQAVLYSDHVYTENQQQVRSVMNIPCNVALDENNSPYDNAMVNEFLYKCKFCDLLFENEQAIKEHISVEHEKKYSNSLKNTGPSIKIENQLITSCNSSESYIQNLELDNFNEHNYHLIQISDLYFENNDNNNIESTLPQISTDKIIANASNSIEIKNFDDLIKIDHRNF